MGTFRAVLNFHGGLFAVSGKGVGSAFAGVVGDATVMDDEWHDAVARGFDCLWYGAQPSRRRAGLGRVEGFAHMA
jgi:hypothetical protein